MFSEPDASYHGLVYTEHFGKAAYHRPLPQRLSATTMGAVLAPLSAFLLLQGIETVALRIERHVENAQQRRGVPARRPAGRLGRITPGLPITPIMPLAQKYLGGRACSLMTFGVSGGFEAGNAVLRRACDCSSGWSTWATPSPWPAIRASTTHRQMSPDEQLKAGVTPEMIRLSVGIEHIDDIIADLDQALAAAAGKRAP